MPSPFPGMNPYLEQADVWQDFHTVFLVTLRGRIVAQVAPDSIVQIEEHLYIHDIRMEEGHRPGRADLSLARASTTTSQEGGLELLEAPNEVYLREQDVERIRFLEIRDRRDRELVTVIELLSPSNKRKGEDREQYLAKRRQLLQSSAHLVEIDLLRGGESPPMENRPDCDYSILVSRAERRPTAQFWPIGLRDRLPLIPIPLREGASDARIDLKDVLDRSFEEPGYENYIYKGQPRPALSAEDQQWAEQFLPKPAESF